MNDDDAAPADLETLFERFESLPSRDAESTKRQLVDAILGTLAARLARADPVDDRFRRVRAAATRVRLLGPSAPGFDEAVLGLIDAVREALEGEDVAGVAPARTSPAPAPRTSDDVVTEASEESFPASDPPGYAGEGRPR